MFHKSKILFIFIRVKYRAAVFTGTFLLIAGIPLTFVNSTVHAAPCNGQPNCLDSLCASDAYCLNAWGGGPWVDVDSNPDTNNSFFATEPIQPGINDYSLEFLGNGSWSGQCVGDAHNESGQNTTSLDPCPVVGQGGGGWGTNFQVTNCTYNGNYGEELKDTHWNKWLAPDGSSNGAPFVLTSTTPVCFVVESFAE